jgi:hypothetical protein
MTPKQIEAGLRLQAAWHDTKATRLAQLAYRANNDTFRDTMLARAEEHSKQSIEAMKKALEIMKGAETAAKKHSKKHNKERFKKKRTSASRKR